VGINATMSFILIFGARTTATINAGSCRTLSSGRSLGTYIVVVRRRATQIGVREETKEKSSLADAQIHEHKK